MNPVSGIRRRPVLICIKAPPAFFAYVRSVRAATARARKPRTMNFERDQIEAAWEHGRTLPEADPSVWRQDGCGAWIRRDQFGREQSEFGWKIENVAGGGPGTAAVLRPFHCRNRFDAANHKPHCAVRADRSGVPPGEFAGPPRNRAIQAGAPGFRT